MKQILTDLSTGDHPCVEACRALLKKVEVLATRTGGHAGYFEWVDGPLLRALERGDWVALDNVNFCNATVLDRLNALLEPGGSLLLNEAGLIDGMPRTIFPHPGFHLFLVMNPRFGEVSRAMRNRCVEVFFPVDMQVVAHVTWGALARRDVGAATAGYSVSDVAAMLSALGVPGTCCVQRSVAAAPVGTRACCLQGPGCRA